jgi:hypothetical protein
MKPHDATFFAGAILQRSVHVFTLVAAWRSEITTRHATKHNTPIQNILSTAPQLSISQKALGTLREYGNVMMKHVGATIRN